MFVVAPPLSVDNVMAVLGGLEEKWDEVGEELYIPPAARQVIKEESSSNLKRLRGIIIRWILTDPLASWRRLIWELENRDDQDFKRVANSIVDYAEKQPG